MNYKIDASLIGGIVIKHGDVVIDGSVVIAYLSPIKIPSSSVKKTGGAPRTPPVIAAVESPYCAVTTISSTARPQSVMLVSDVKRKRIFTLLWPAYELRLCVLCVHDG